MFARCFPEQILLGSVLQNMSEVGNMIMLQAKSMEFAIAANLDIILLWANTVDVDIQQNTRFLLSFVSTALFQPRQCFGWSTMYLNKSKWNITITHNFPFFQWSLIPLTNWCQHSSPSVKMNDSKWFLKEVNWFRCPTPKFNNSLNRFPFFSTPPFLAPLSKVVFDASPGPAGGADVDGVSN